jgi:hypothetical protein
MEANRGCGMSRLPHFLDSLFTDDEVVSLTYQPVFTPTPPLLRRFFLAEAGSTKGQDMAGRIRSVGKMQ